MVSNISRCSWNYNKFMQVKHHTWAAADHIALDCTGWFRRYNWCRTYCSTACKNLSLTNLLWIQQSHSTSGHLCSTPDVHAHAHYIIIISHYCILLWLLQLCNSDNYNCRAHYQETIYLEYNKYTRNNQINANVLRYDNYESYIIETRSQTINSSTLM